MKLIFSKRRFETNRSIAVLPTPQGYITGNKKR